MTARNVRSFQVFVFWGPWAGAAPAPAEVALSPEAAELPSSEHKLTQPVSSLCWVPLQCPPLFVNITLPQTFSPKAGLFLTKDIMSYLLQEYFQIL